MLALQTVLGSDGSATDRLIIDGGAVSSRTSIQVTYLGGLGAATTSNGILLVGAINGGATTATTTTDAFTLAGGQIDAGAFEYRLYASDRTGTSEGWFLRTQTETETPLGPQLPDTTYRVEVPLLAALPGLLRQGDLEFLGTYHRRLGDRTDVGQTTAGFTVPGRLWGRFLLDDYRYRQGGTVRPSVDGRTYGFQLGADLFRYVDTVVQRSWYDGDARVANGSRIDTDGTGIIASVETGYAFTLSSHWLLRPQAQVTAQGVSLHPVTIPPATVLQDSDGHVTGRIGVRLKGDYAVGSGGVQPYVRANLWKGFASTDRTVFVTKSASTSVNTRNSSLWGEAGGGLTWLLARRFAIYGEATHRFNLDNGQGVTGHSTGGAVGVKLDF